ncbi:MAG: ATP-binding cassette domain-containing protein, partial [Clostridia bacterium]
MFELKNVCKKYENGYVAISDISLEIGKVGLVAITGESGAGKTTLLNLLAKNDNITSGSVKFCKKELSECTESEIAQQFAFIFQDYKLIENMTVLENLSIAVELAGLPVDMPKIDNYLQKYKLQEHKNNKVSTLSGGQKQRISIIRALLRQPKVIFADEPTGNLDTQNTETIFEELKEIAKTQLVILVSHNKESVNKFADRVINLIDGKIATDSANNCGTVLEENTAEAIEKTAEITAENKRGKGRLQAKTAVKTAFSFYKIKSLTNVVNVMMIILTAIIMFVGLNISMTSYEDV